MHALAPFDRRAIPAGLRFGEWIAPDGWRLRRFDWAPKAARDGRARGSVLFQAGRADFTEKYLETLAHFVACGWHVSGFDWRGQGGSGRRPRETLAGQVEDLAAYCDAWIARSPGPHVLVGHSMGGYLALDYLAERQPVGIDAAVLVAPMLGLNARPLPRWLATLVARGAAMIGLGDRQAWADDRPMRARNLTSCPDRYADEMWWRREAPSLVLGAPTWGWLAEAFAATGRLRRSQELAGVGTPLLILASRNDRLIDFGAIADIATRLPDARLVVSERGAHELLREADAERMPLLAQINAFLDARAPAA